MPGNRGVGREQKGGATSGSTARVLEDRGAHEGKEETEMEPRRLSPSEAVHRFNVHLLTRVRNVAIVAYASVNVAEHSARTQVKQSTHRMSTSSLVPGGW